MNRHHLRPIPASWNARLHHHSDQNCDDWLDDVSVINETNATETEMPTTQSNNPSVALTSLLTPQVSMNNPKTI